MSEIETILRNGLTRLISEKGLEKFAARVFESLSALVKRVDLETYGTFSAIMLDEGPELQDFSDVSLEDKSSLRELADQFYSVLYRAVLLTEDFQRLYNVRRGD
jgi:hypothetical protein